MKIRLIEPAPAHLHMWSYTFLPRLGLPLIGAGLEAAGHDVVIYCPQFSPIDWDDVLGADLVGISTTTSTAPAAYEIAARVREHGVPTIVGGSHVTFMADEALAHADYVARGEGGDALMLELIEVLRGERTLETIDGLSFTRDGEAVHNPPREACRDLDTLPVPDLTLIAGSRRPSRHHADHDELRLPLRLQLLLGDGDVRAQVPLPQPGAHHGRDRGQAAPVDLLLRRQLRRRQAPPQDAAAYDDRPRAQHPVVGAGAHRRRPTTPSSSS